MTYKRTAIIVLLMAATAALTGLVSRTEQILPNKPFSEFPLSVGERAGTKNQLDERVYNVLGVEDYVMADYRNMSSGSMVNLYVGFYQSQKEGDIIHSPRNCMPGAGWKITESSIKEINLTNRKDPINVAKLLIQKGSQKQMVLYWFQSRGRIISSEYWQKIWLVMDSVTRQRTDGSFVRLISPVTTDEQHAATILEAFVKDIFPALSTHIPS